MISDFFVRTIFGGKCAAHFHGIFRHKKEPSKYENSRKNYFVVMIWLLYGQSISDSYGKRPLNDTPKMVYHSTYPEPPLPFRVTLSIFVFSNDFYEFPDETERFAKRGDTAPQHAELREIRVFSEGEYPQGRNHGRAKAGKKAAPHFRLDLCSEKV